MIVAKTMLTKSTIETVNYGAAAVDIGSRIHIAAVNPDATNKPGRHRRLAGSALRHGAFSM
jgi:hypothetical protein